MFFSLKDLSLTLSLTPSLFSPDQADPYNSLSDEPVPSLDTDIYNKMNKLWLFSYHWGLVSREKAEQGGEEGRYCEG